MHCHDGIAKAKPGLLPAVLARSVNAEREEEERRILQRSWEMATILDFLELFRPYLNLSRGFTVHELESVLILSPGGEGLLGSLHMVSLTSRPGLHVANNLCAVAPEYFTLLLRQHAPCTCMHVQLASSL